MCFSNFLLLESVDIVDANLKLKDPLFDVNEHF